VLDIIFFRDIGMHKDGFATGITDGPGDLLTLFVCYICDNDAGSFERKYFGGELTHAACGTGDDRYFVC
jgi:hypothetical protein